MEAKELLGIWARNFTGRLALRGLIDDAVQELSQIGLENIRLFVNSNRSLVETYISALSPEVKSEIKSQVENLQRAGVSIDTILNIVLPEFKKKLPQYFRVLTKNKVWYQNELQRIRNFLS